MERMFKRLMTLKFRKKRRYRVKSGLYAVVENSTGKNQIDDIGMGGLSYYYIDSGIRPKKHAYDLTVLPENQQPPVQFSCKTVSDRETGELIFQNQRIKRRSVRFERLNIEQKQKLKHLIRDYTRQRY